MKRWQKRLLILLAVAAVILFFRLVVFRPSPVPVSVYTVDRGRVEDTVVNSRAGTVESRLRARMSPSLAGRVTAIPVKKGTRVKKGQVLLRLDDSEHRAQAALAARSRDAYAAAAKEACLAADQTLRDLKRAEGLAARNLLSDEGLETARTRSETAVAGCEAARERTRQGKAALDAAQATLDKTTLNAPFDGVVLDVTTEVGEWISPSPPGVFIPPIMDLIDPDSLYVSAPLDEADIARVELGLPVRITMDAFKGLSFPGRVSYIASYVETRQEQNRTLPIEAVFDDQELPKNLLPGISSDVEIILDTRESVVRIPSYALLEGDRVYVVEEDRVAVRTVAVGLRNWVYTEITQGLAEGDRVVVSLDRADVKEGVRIRIEGSGT